MTRLPAYYNEHDPATARWLRELMHEGLIARGDVDERSIRDVRAEDLRGYAQCHFFAGVGVWSHALRRAGWPDDRPVWTGSCPCQPFSAAGKGLGFADDRHLWPEFLRLIGERRPHVVFGEQVASADAWIDLVSADLENLSYAFGAPDLPAAGFDGAHIRQRRYWVADTDNAEWWSERAPRNDGDWPATGRVEGDGDVGGRRPAGGVADQTSERWERGQGAGGPLRWPLVEDGCTAGGPRHTGLSGPQGRHVQCEGGYQRSSRPSGLACGRPGAADGGGGAVDWLFCRDGRVRPVEAGTFPLASEAPARVGRLRGYGNALDAEVATQFIAAYLDCAPPEQVAA